MYKSVYKKYCDLLPAFAEMTLDWSPCGPEAIRVDLSTGRSFIFRSNTLGFTLRRVNEARGEH